MLPGRFGAVASTIRSKFVVHKHIASSEHRTGRWWSLEGQLLHTNSNSDTVSANSALLIRESPRWVTSLVLRHPFWGSALRVLNGAKESSTITRIPRQGEEVRPLGFWIPCGTTRWFPIPMLSSRSNEQDLDRPETSAHTTPSLSTRQPPETQIRRWPELDRLLVARPPPP